ncbi:MAG: holo-ACP synthase [Thermoplasmata archaeon]|nr:MAG: holo-ACP synthase [Thermoplasmata archaeon]
MEIGVDCVNIDRFEKENLSSEALLKKIFTEKEILYCEKKTKSSQHYAVRFAGKEAVMKALNQYNIKIPTNKIEILNNEKGIPYVRILDNNLNDLDVKISLSHSKDIAIAMAIIYKK